MRHLHGPVAARGFTIVGSTARRVPQTAQATLVWTLRTRSHHDCEKDTKGCDRSSALATMCSIAGAGPAAANDFSVTFPAGTACAFPLRVDGTGGHRIEHTFTSKDGTVPVLSTGTGSALTFTNGTTGASVSLRPNGAVQRTTSLADGSTLNVLAGHNVLFLFPTDVPAGPSTTLHRPGRLQRHAER